jgi:hypothetical protein
VPDFKKRGEVRERFAKLFGPVLERGRREGLLVADPEGLQPLALHGLVQAYFGLAADAPKRLSPARAVDAVLSAFLDGAVKRGRG